MHVLRPPYLMPHQQNVECDCAFVCVLCVCGVYYVFVGCTMCLCVYYYLFVCVLCVCGVYYLCVCVCTIMCFWGVYYVFVGCTIMCLCVYYVFVGCTISLSALRLLHASVYSNSARLSALLGASPRMI